MMVLQQRRAEVRSRGEGRRQTEGSDGERLRASVLRGLRRMELSLQDLADDVAESVVYPAREQRARPSERAQEDGRSKTRRLPS